ncbi:MAG: InlB B-repeat-containing protein, partial [Atopobiaceae bacterium]|nr:InlB B-repeat-containing protein [Atopobiaceae bacterium]
PSTLKVTYDLNATEASVSFVDENGVSLPNPQSVGFSKDVDVADDSAYAQIPTQEGHHFVGWNTKADGTGAAFAPGSTLYHCDGESNGEMTLYAQWEESEHVARISRDGGKTWTYYGALITGDYDGTTVDGAFDAANTGSGNVIIETLYAEHDRYALTKCFTFSRAADITIRANPKLAGKSRIVKAQATDPVIIYNGYRKTFTLQDLTFDGQNNPTTSGRGGIIRRGGSNGPYGLTITDCDFINACTSGDNGQGGAIAWEQAVTINHTTGDAMRFENCHASKAGGAIYTSGAFTVNLNNTGNGDVVFSECSSGTTGGALYVGDNDSATLRINNSGKGTISFANCTTTSGAGGAVGCGIFVADSNRGTIRFKDCEAITTGGAINCTSTSNSTYSNMNSNDGTIVFDSCHAQGNGGAVAYQRLFQAVGNAGKITFSDCQSGGNGGAVAGAHNSSTRKLEFRNTVGG